MHVSEILFLFLSTLEQEKRKFSLTLLLAVFHVIFYPTPHVSPHKVRERDLSRNLHEIDLQLVPSCDLSHLVRTQRECVGRIGNNKRR